jgi:hypothetical protein
VGLISEQDQPLEAPALENLQLAESSTKETGGEGRVTTKLCGPALEMKSQGYNFRSKALEEKYKIF